MLQKTSIELPFGVGIDESVQKELLDANAAVARAQNVRVNKSGSYAKRHGLAAYPRGVVGGGTVTSGFSVHEYDERYPVITDAKQLYDWSEQQQKWIAKDLVSEVVVTRTGGVQPPPNAWIYQYDSVVANGVRVTILGTPRGDAGGLANDDLNNNYTDVYYQVDDVASGASLQPLTLLAQMFGAGVVGSLAIGSTPDGYITVFGHETTRNGSNVVTQIRFQAWTFNTATPASAPAVSVIETNNTVIGFNLVALSPTPRGNSLVILYKSCALNEFRIRTFIPATGVAPASVLSPVQNISATAYFCRGVCILWDAPASVLWLVFRDDAVGAAQNISARVLDSSYVQIASSSLTVFNVLSAEASSITCVLGENTGGVSRDLWISVSRLVDGHRFAATEFRTAKRPSAAVLSVASLTTRYGIMAYSAPFNRGGRWYQWFQPVPVDKKIPAYRAPLSALPYVVLCEVPSSGTTLRPVANVAPQLVDKVNHARYPHLVQQTSSDTYEVPLAVVRNASTTNLETVSIDFSDRRKLRSAPFGDVLVLGGGATSYYDGTQLAEVGFIHPPTITSTVTPWVSGQPGGKVVAGTYSCFAVWRRTDARGNVHVSDISNVLTLVIAADSTVQIDLHPLVLTASDKGDAAQLSSVRAYLYITRINQSTFYECDDVPAISQGGNLVKSLYFDTDRNILFYTQPGVLNAALFRYAPPSLRCVVQHNGALAGVAEDGRTIWFSGLHLAGEGPWFHPALVGYVDDLSTINALASLDGRLYAFTQSGIWAIDGNGFADNGEGGYSAPVRIAADAGCINERSVVVTPVGVLFQSELGLALLSRAGQVSWFGRVVEDTLSAFPIVTSAVLVRPAGEVRFTLSTAAGLSAWLAWSYRDNVWTMHLPRPDMGPIVDTAMVQQGSASRWHAMTAGGHLLVESDGYREVRADLVPTDGYVSTLVETAWIKVAGVQGFQRIWRVLLLFNRLSPAGLRLSLFYDYDAASPVEVREWSAAEVTALERGAVEIHCQKQKCTSIKVRVECTNPGSATDGNSFEYLGLRLVCGTKAKTPRGAKAR